jgi:hypothetical protein
MGEELSALGGTLYIYRHMTVALHSMVKQLVVLRYRTERVYGSQPINYDAKRPGGKEGMVSNQVKRYYCSSHVYLTFGPLQTRHFRHKKPM